MNLNGNEKESDGTANIERSTPWWIHAVVLFFAILWLFLIGSGWAETESQMNDFKWLDPEKKIVVLQNRKYTKANRVLISVSGGMGFSNPYRNEIHLEPRLSYYMTEMWGLEIFYLRNFNKKNHVFDALIHTNVNVYPVIRELEMGYGALLQWAPWYSKINVFNTILYFDWYFSGGVGTLQSQLDQNPGGTPNLTKQDLFSIFINTGHQYHISQNFAVRLDFTTNFYRGLVFGTQGENVWFSNISLALGFGLRI